ncbi:MAG TPA: hypothetical protein VN843_11185, partial [Anaerolineales bacterium]|nr:hypothetical protein [Anaerolineales bacterium]
SNPVNAQIQPELQGVLILNDDALELLREDSGPTATQAAALDALLLLRDPFRVVSVPEGFATGPDRNTRVMVFVRNLRLVPGETAATVGVRLMGSDNQIRDVVAESLRTVPNTDLTQVVFRLPDGLPAGNCSVTIRVHEESSNTGTIRIAP